MNVDLIRPFYRVTLWLFRLSAQWTCFSIRMAGSRVTKADKMVVIHASGSSEWQLPWYIVWYPREWTSTSYRLRCTRYYRTRTDTFILIILCHFTLMPIQIIILIFPSSGQWVTGNALPSSLSMLSRKLSTRPTFVRCSVLSPPRIYGPSF